MATRQEIGQRSDELESWLRRECRHGASSPGSRIQPVRRLAEQHAVSIGVVSRVVQKLVDEGLLYTTHGGGTYIGRPIRQNLRYYVLLNDANFSPSAQYAPTKMGFEERISQRGGAVMEMGTDVFQARCDNRTMPALGGVFKLAQHLDEVKTHLARLADEGTAFIELNYGEIRANIQRPYICDRVSIDDVAAGRLATQHLIECGHRNVAFLGYHVPKRKTVQYSWSLDRESGWRSALQSASLSCKLAFHPAAEPAVLEDETLAVSALSAAREIVRHAEITGVVAANDIAAQALLNACIEYSMPLEKWPSVVGFDNSWLAESQGLTSFRLPWEEVGRAAADALWNRSHGTTQGELRDHVVSTMPLMSRVTSTLGWAALHVPAMKMQTPLVARKRASSLVAVG